MKYLIAILIGPAAILTSFAQKIPLNQYAHVDKKILLMPDSSTRSTTDIAAYITTGFSTEKDRVRAAYIWVASNIQYDMANMFAINFYEKGEEKILKALTARKGICEAYAAIFQDICTNMGVESFVIEGYTKQNGFADYIPHAWCAARTDGTWLLYDPTWGSGYVSGGKFYRKLNETYFAAKPSVLIKSHMPFDYLWQFLYYPVTNQEFYEGKTAEGKAKPYFSFPDSILAYESMAHTEQLSSVAVRIEAAGLKNSMIFDRLRHIKAELEHEKQLETVGLYNGAIADFNEGISYYNEFISYRNKQFTPLKPDADIQEMLDRAAEPFAHAKINISKLKRPDDANEAAIVNLSKMINDAEATGNEMQAWLTKYFSKGKIARKSMFYKVTWFGVPLN